MLVISIFSFSSKFFRSAPFQDLLCEKGVKLEMCIKELTHSHTITAIEVPGETSLLKTLWEKEKLLITSNFSFSHSIFYPFG